MSFHQRLQYGLAGMALGAAHQLNALAFHAGAMLSGTSSVASSNNAASLVTIKGLSQLSSYSLIASVAHHSFMSIDTSPFDSIMSDGMELVSWIIFILILWRLVIEVLKVLADNTPAKRSEMIKSITWTIVIGAVYFVARVPIVNEIKTLFGVNYTTSGFTGTN